MDESRGYAGVDLDEAIRYSENLVAPMRTKLSWLQGALTVVIIITLLVAVGVTVSIVTDGVEQDNRAIRESDYKAIQVATIAGLNITKYDMDVMVRTVIGEAAKESDEGKIAVAWVILNRSIRDKRFFGGSNVADVALRRSSSLRNGRRITTWQFEPWMHGHTRSALWSISESNTLYMHVHELVSGCVVGLHADPTDGATHFLNPDILRIRGVPLPSWARGEGKRIGRHVFYRN